MKYTQPKIIREKTARKQAQRQFWKVFLIEGGLFFLTLMAAIIGAFKLNQLASTKSIYLPTTSLQDFLFSFFVITLLVLLFVFYKKARKFREIVYKGFFIIACFWGGMAILSLFIPVLGAVFIMGALIFLWMERPSIWAHDVLVVLGLSGAGSFLGLSFSPAIAVVLLLIFSVYDFIAVYKTKHMVAMAKDMIEKKVILGFIIPKELKYFRNNFAKVKVGGNFLILGGGDVVFPALLAVSIVPQSFLNAFIVVLFSATGSLLSYWIFVRGKEPIPALPPIALISIIGYLITLLF